MGKSPEIRWKEGQLQGCGETETITLRVSYKRRQKKQPGMLGCPPAEQVPTACSTQSPVPTFLKGSQGRLRQQLPKGILHSKFCGLTWAKLAGPKYWAKRVPLFLSQAGYLGKGPSMAWSYTRWDLFKNSTGKIISGHAFLHMDQNLGASEPVTYQNSLVESSSHVLWDKWDQWFLNMILGDTGPTRKFMKMVR